MPQDDSAGKGGIKAKVTLPWQNSVICFIICLFSPILFTYGPVKNSKLLQYSALRAGSRHPCWVSRRAVKKT